MISTIFRGQLGNQMFQCAAAMVHADKQGTDYAFPTRSGKRQQFPFMFQDKLPTIDNLSSQYLELPICQEQRFGVYQELPAEKDLILKGYWQNYKYFIDHKNSLYTKFGFEKRTYGIVDNGLELLSDFVSLHIRRGDSLRFIDKLPQPTDKYLYEALEYFPGSRILVFTDDLEWCMNKFTGDRFAFADPCDDPLEAMIMMSNCGGHIIVNSTFSWWAAFMSSCNVVCPSERSWFGNRYKHLLSAEGLIVPYWIQVDY